MTDQTSVLARLEEAARTLTLARKLPEEGPLSPDLVGQIVDDFNAFIAEHQISHAMVAHELGEGYSTSTIWTFSNSKEGKFVGDMQRIARGINAWLGVRRRQATNPMPARFVETTVAKRMMALVLNTVSMRSIGLIFSDSGRGKTTVLKVAAAKYPGAIYLRVTQSTRTGKGLAKALCAQLKIERANTFFEAQRLLIEKLEKSQRVILLDEGHELHIDGFALLRDLHDVCEIPVVVAGTKRLSDKVDDATEWFGQLSSRIALRYDVTEKVRAGGRDGRKAKPLFTDKEIEQIFTSDRLKIDAQGLAYLTQMSNALGQGGLRLVEHIVEVAATMRPGVTLDAKLLRSVFSSMQPEDVVQSVQFRASHAVVSSGEESA